MPADDSWCLMEVRDCFLFVSTKGAFAGVTVTAVSIMSCNPFELKGGVAPRRSRLRALRQLVTA